MVSILVIDELLVQVYIAGFILFERLIVVFPLEGVVPNQQHVRDNAETEDVALRPIGFLALPCILYYLGSHVSHGPASLVGLHADGLVEVEGETEVDDERLEVGQVYQDILGFKVPVDYVGLVDIPQSFEALPEEEGNNVGLVDFLLLEQSHEILAWKILQDHHIVLLFLEKFLEFVDVLTFYQSQYLPLFEHQWLRADFVFVLLVYYLSCELSFIATVPHSENLR